jgi:hypothetical protein
LFGSVVLGRECYWRLLGFADGMVEASPFSTSHDPFICLDADFRSNNHHAKKERNHSLNNFLEGYALGKSAVHTLI